MSTRIAAVASILSVMTLAAGCGDDGAGGSSQPSGSMTTPPTTETEHAALGKQAGTGRSETASVFFTTGEQFRKVERPLPEGEDELMAATEALVEGPTPRERNAEVGAQTQIPVSTEVDDVSVDGGTAVVEVSPQFTAGIPSDPARRSRAEESELDARLAQVTYTLTQFPQVKAAKVMAGGRPLERGLARRDLQPPERGPRRIARAKGPRGGGTRALQTRLAELRYLPKSAVDGIDGYRTQQAVIAFQSWRGLERDGVVGPATQAALAKASPPSPKGSGPSRRIEVYPDRGVALLIKEDRTLRAIHVSAGASGTATPAGTFSVFRKELNSWSVPFQTWLPYASYFNAGIAFHEYPDVPTYPASHGCVRVPAPEAKGVYRFAKFDTTVIVF
ncbi:MAG: peptidoglycan-binding protein [Solirubrobacterales bacterium]